jgi:hypothetical protein
MQKGNYEGGRPSVWVKAPEGAQEALFAEEPDRFFVPPYGGGKGWVGVHLDTRAVDWDELADLVEESYRLIAPKRLAALLARSRARRHRGRRGRAAPPASCRR